MTSVAAQCRSGPWVLMPALDVSGTTPARGRSPGDRPAGTSLVMRRTLTSPRKRAPRTGSPIPSGMARISASATAFGTPSPSRSLVETGGGCVEVAAVIRAARLVAHLDCGEPILTVVDHTMWHGRGTPLPDCLLLRPVRSPRVRSLCHPGVGNADYGTRRLCYRSTRQWRRRSLHDANRQEGCVLEATRDTHFSGTTEREKGTVRSLPSAGCSRGPRPGRLRTRQPGPGGSGRCRILLREEIRE